MSLVNGSDSSLSFDVPFGLDDDVVDFGMYPCVACSHFSNINANNENNGCLCHTEKKNTVYKAILYGIFHEGKRICLFDF